MRNNIYIYLSNNRTVYTLAGQGEAGFKMRYYGVICFDYNGKTHTTDSSYAVGQKTLPTVFSAICLMLKLFESRADKKQLIQNQHNK